MSVLRHKYEEMEKKIGIKIEPRFVIDGRILVDYDKTYDYFSYGFQIKLYNFMINKQVWSQLFDELLKSLKGGHGLFKGEKFCSSFRKMMKI